jgi:hypothetical protein
MNSTRALYLMVPAMILIACATTRAEPRYFEAQEAAIRRLITDLPHDTEIILIAFGADAAGRYIDPPPEFIKRLANLPKPIKPATAGEFDLSPQNKNSKKKKGHWGWTDRATHQRAWLYSITIDPISPTKIGLAVTSTGGPLSGGAYHFTATLDAKGHWKVEGPNIDAVF